MQGLVLEEIAPALGPDGLRDRCDFVRTQVAGVVQEPERLFTFLYHYTTWNATFGSGVAALAGKLGRCRQIFRDPDESSSFLADRSVQIASYVFDAARDEFGDPNTARRATHRCLAQATLQATFRFFFARNVPLEASGCFTEPTWLRDLVASVSTGYGTRLPDDAPHVARSLGYHVGSEILADREFTIIDRQLRAKQPELVAYLNASPPTTDGLNAYLWIRLHSSHTGGAGVEADHFEAALRAVRLALHTVPTAERERFRAEIVQGVRAFAADQRTFFERV